MLAGQTARVIACGHTHLPLIRRLEQQTIVNAGSVGGPFLIFPFEGWPRQVGWAEYALVDWLAGSLRLELRQVPLDIEAMKASALTTDMPGAAEWVAMWPV
jgi:hypothetical protein